MDEVSIVVSSFSLPKTKYSGNGKPLTKALSTTVVKRLMYSNLLLVQPVHTKENCQATPTNNNHVDNEYMYIIL